MRINEFIDFCLEEFDTGFMPFLMLMVIGILLIGIGLFGPSPIPNAKLIAWIYLGVSIILIEWTFLDACRNGGLTLDSLPAKAKFSDYLLAKLLSIIVVAFGLPALLAIIGLLVGVPVGVGYLIYLLIKWIGLNMRTTILVFGTLGLIAAYFGLNILVGKMFRGKK